MRLRNVVTLGLSVTALIGGLIVGCSKNSSGPSNPITNPEFKYMASQTNESVDSLVALSGLGLAMTIVETTEGLNDAAFGPMPVDSSLLTNLWHIFLLTNSESGPSNRWVDSVQFLLNGVAKEDPASSNEMQYIRNWTSTPADTSVSYRELEARTLLNADNTTSQTATVTGTFVAAIKDVDKSGDVVVVRNLTFDGAVASYAVDRNFEWHGGCPTSAQVTIEATLSVQQGAADPVVSTWTFDVVIADGEATVTVTENAVKTAYWLTVCTM